MYQVLSNWCLCSTLLSSIHLIYFRWIKTYYVFSVSYKSVAFLWILTHWYHKICLSTYVLFWLQPHQCWRDGNCFPHFNCSISVSKSCAILLLTHFTTHYYPHIWFCIIYIYLFLIWHFTYVVFNVIYHSLVGSLQVTTPVYQDFSFIYPLFSFFLAWWQKSTDFCTRTVMFNTISHERCEIIVAQEEACMCH